VKAAIFTEPNQPFQLQSLPDPEPGVGEVVIKVCRCGICGSDINMTSGSAFDFPTGKALGHEYAGEIVALGADIKHLRVGDRITGMPRMGCGQCEACDRGFYFHCSQGQSYMGGYGEYTVIDERVAYKLSDSLSYEDGALVEPLACGCRAVRHANVGPGMKTLIIGAGAMGMAALFWARQKGAEYVAVTARSDTRKELAMTMGASHFIKSDQDLAGNLMETFGGLPDVIIECAGASGTIAESLNLIRPGGTIVVLGACSHAVEFVPMIALGREARIQFSLAYDTRDFQETLDVLSAGATTPRTMVQDTVSLEELPQRLQKMRNPHPECKVMVNPWQ
jgi:2-desacetyl-2-hydroxyethyl bacteriochlorophyllide A dehydrogenase